MKWETERGVKKSGPPGERSEVISQEEGRGPAHLLIVLTLENKEKAEGL